MSTRAASIVIAITTMLPLALVHGVIHFTSLLRFGPSHKVEVLRAATEVQLQADCTRAAGLGLLFHAVMWLSLVAPYLTIVQARLKAEDADAHVDVILRSLFLVSLPWAVFSLAAWFMPMGAQSGLKDVIVFLVCACYVYLVIQLKHAAHEVARLDEMAAWLVVFVSLLTHATVSALLFERIARFLPPPPVDAAVSLSNAPIWIGLFA